MGRYVVAPDPHSNHGDVQLTLGLVLKRAAQRLGLQATTSFNLGRPDDFRVPDDGLIPWPAGVWHDTAVLVAEILSPMMRPSPSSTSTVGTASPSCWWPTGAAVRCAVWRCRRTRRSATTATCSG